MRLECRERKTGDMERRLEEAEKGKGNQRPPRVEASPFSSKLRANALLQSL